MSLIHANKRPGRFDYAKCPGRLLFTTLTLPSSIAATNLALYHNHPILTGAHTTDPPSLIPNPSQKSHCIPSTGIKSLPS